VRDNTVSSDELAVRAEVKAAHELSGGSAGARTVSEIVTQRGTKLSRYRVSRLMKQLGLVSCQMPQHAYKKASKKHLKSI
jgi:putative transposase